MTDRTAGRLHIGTSGWAYPHWKGIFYPAGLPQRLWLEYYSAQFNATEVNSTFYRLPGDIAVRAWAEMAIGQFRFCPKISRFVTHAKKLNDPQQAVPRFLDLFGIIHDRVGPVLIQLPAMLPFRKDKADNFFSYLKTNYPQFLFALEARHATWITREAAALLEKYCIAWVIADSGTRFASKEQITARHIYLRFHGPDGSYSTGYSKKALSAVACKCRSWNDQHHDVWVFFNNDINGHAVRDARLLKQMLESI